MLKRWLLAGAMSLALGGAAQAQTYRDSGGTVTRAVVPLVGCTANGNCTGPVSAANPLPVSGGFSGALPAGSNTIGGVVLDSSASANFANLHAATSALGASLVLKSSAGNLYSVNATAVAGGAAGYLVVINATAAPSSGAAIAPLDFCYFPAGAVGCSLNHGAIPINYSTGIVALVTTASSPYTFTSGTDTAAISGDFE